MGHVVCNFEVFQKKVCVCRKRERENDKRNKMLTIDKSSSRVCEISFYSLCRQFSLSWKYFTLKLNKCYFEHLTIVSDAVIGMIFKGEQDMVSIFNPEIQSGAGRTKKKARTIQCGKGWHRRGMLKPDFLGWGGQRRLFTEKVKEKLNVGGTN